MARRGRKPKEKPQEEVEFTEDDLAFLEEMRELTEEFQ